ncbi:MAG: hypothetical protein HUJ26_07855 [Planctomycetaceae bacterium]|nr:hypothetical protein [Planctomycetaceae bacterium]
MGKAGPVSRRLDTTLAGRYLAVMSDPSASIPDVPIQRAHPRLLISVRNQEEALVAQQMEVDLIDLKEPVKGSLGMVDLEIARGIAEELPSATLSLALGELSDWRESEIAPRIPSAFRYLKLGLADQVSRSDWKCDWRGFRERVERQSEQSFDWIAVVYVDHLAANSPDPEEIIAAAIETRCAGVLFDTWSKEAGSLLDHVAPQRLAGFASTIHAAGLLTAFAGSLRADHLKTLLPILPTIVAVRGAVCDDSNRVGRLSASRIRAFQEQLQHPVSSGK